MHLSESAAFQSRVEELMEEWHTPGLAIAVIQDNQTSSRGFGHASFSPERKVTGDTIFNIASCSKSITAACLALLVDDDHKHPNVQWDAIVAELLPDDFAMAEESYTQTVTIEDILSHRTGLPRHDWSKFGPRSKHPDSICAITRNVRNLPIVAPVRSKCLYNNLLYTVAAYLVEYSSGLPFHGFMKQHIFDPLGMPSTFLGPLKGIEAGFEQRTGYPYYWDEAASTYRRVEVEDAPESAGAGMLASSVNDFAKWVKALMYQEAPVNERIVRDLTTPRAIFHMYEDTAKFSPYTSATLYALGLKVVFYRGYRIIYHTGGMPGVASRLFILPEIKFGGVIIGNASGAHSVIRILMYELIDAALNIPKIERANWNAMQHIRKREDAEKEESTKRKRRERLLSDEEPLEATRLAPPQVAYIGRYHNVGYGPMEVKLREESLYIDATGRTFGFTLDRFEECGKPGSYIAHGRNFLDNGEPLEMAVQFHFEGSEVVALSIEMEPLIEDGVRFERLYS